MWFCAAHYYLLWLVKLHLYISVKTTLLFCWTLLYLVWTLSWEDFGLLWDTYIFHYLYHCSSCNLTMRAYGLGYNNTTNYVWCQTDYFISDIIHACSHIAISQIYLSVYVCLVCLPRLTECLLFLFLACSCALHLGGSLGMLCFPPPDGYSPVCCLESVDKSIQLCPFLELGNLKEMTLFGPTIIAGQVPFTPQPIDTSQVHVGRLCLHVHTLMHLHYLKMEDTLFAKLFLE